MNTKHTKRRDPGAADKRLLVHEPEFGRVLSVASRQGNTLSAIIRQAWETGDLNVLTKNNPVKASGAHISVVAHVTVDELRRKLPEAETANGFANRFLYGCVRRSKLLPEGGQIPDEQLKPLITQLGKAVQLARKRDRINFDGDARRIWHEVYPELSKDRPGLFGAVCGRAEAQVLRLALIYALLDCALEIRAEHLLAALAVWQYCEDSAGYIFGSSLGNATADVILRALRDSTAGLTRTQISQILGRNTVAAEIEAALQLLLKCSLARRETRETVGRAAEVWFARNPH